MPGSNSATKRPGIVAPCTQLFDGRATYLKSANTIDYDWPVSRQLFDPAGQCGRCVHCCSRQHIDASGQVVWQTEIEKYRMPIIVLLKLQLELFGGNPCFLLRGSAIWNREFIFSRFLTER